MAKPTHIKAIAELLTSDEFESPQDMAKAILNHYDDLRSEDMQFMTVREHAHDEGSAYFGTGPYATHAQALKAIEKARAGYPQTGAIAVVPIFHPKRMERAVKKADEFPDYHAGHWALYRERAGI